MVYKLTDISHLEKMSEIKEKDAIIPEVELFEKIEPSSLDNTILSLCTKLRGEGFAKYADGLEDKFIKYKLVAKGSKKHLYNTHDESGEDLVNSAHPDGDLSIGDATEGNGNVLTPINKHKRIVDIISKEPTGKLAVAQCKIVLADFLGSSSSSSQETRKFQDKFGVFVTNLLPDLNAVVVALTDFQDVKLSNGKTVSEYSPMTMPEVFSSFIRSGQWATDDGAKRIINASDVMFKRLYDLIAQIDKTIDTGSNVFPNKNFPEAAYARLNTHREEFLSLYADFNKDSGAAQWHGQFISPDALSTSITSLNEKLNSIVARIDRHIIAEPAFQKLPKFLAWVNSAKEYVKNIENELIALVGKARSYVDEKSQVHQGQNALIDANKLKQFLQDLRSPEIKSDETNSNDANVFVKSLNKIYTDTLSAVINAINATPIDNNLKQTIMEHFSDE